MWRDWEKPPRFVCCYWVCDRWQVQSNGLVVHEGHEYQLRAWLLFHGYVMVATNLYERTEHAA